MSKHYSFQIHAVPAERGACEGFVTMYVTQSMHFERHDGTIDTASKRVQALKEELKASRTFDQGRGFSIFTTLERGQRKPIGFDKRKNRELATNYLQA